MRKHMLKRFIAGAAGAGCLLIGAPTMAADWLSLQGTEPAGAAERAKIWGFIQPQYTDMDGTKLKVKGIAATFYFNEADQNPAGGK